MVVVECDRRKLDGMSRTKSHQGVVAVSAVREYASVEDILAAARDKGEAPLIVVCDELSDPPQSWGGDPHSLECAGAHGVVIPKRRSAGADRHCGQNFGRGGELSACSPGGKPDLPAQRAEKGGAVGVWHCRRWKYQSVRHADLKGPAVIVIGSEGGTVWAAWFGSSAIFSVHPYARAAQFLNASAAAAVVLYEAVRQRG